MDKKALVAVLVENYSFVLVDIKEITVSVHKTDIRVRINNCVYSVYEPKTIEYSQILNNLIDTHDEYRISDYEVNK